jgi:hypothetical protein
MSFNVLKWRNTSNQPSTTTATDDADDGKATPTGNAHDQLRLLGLQNHGNTCYVRALSRRSAARTDLPRPGQLCPASTLLLRTIPARSPRRPTATHQPSCTRNCPARRRECPSCCADRPVGRTRDLQGLLVPSDLGIETQWTARHPDRVRRRPGQASSDLIERVGRRSRNCRLRIRLLGSRSEGRFPSTLGRRYPSLDPARSLLRHLLPSEAAGRRRTPGIHQSAPQGERAVPVDHAPGRPRVPRLPPQRRR